jgi:hypothetical protein
MSPFFRKIPANLSPKIHRRNINHLGVTNDHQRLHVAAIIACGEADQERQLSSTRSAGRQRFVLGQPLTGNNYHCHWGDGGRSRETRGRSCSLTTLPSSRRRPSAPVIVVIVNVARLIQQDQCPQQWTRRDKADTRAVKSPTLVWQSRLKDGKSSPKWGRTRGQEEDVPRGGGGGSDVGGGRGEHSGNGRGGSNGGSRRGGQWTGRVAAV